MAKNLKYWYEFKSLENSLFKVEFLEEGFTGSVTEVQAGTIPVELNYNKDVGEKYLGGFVPLIANFEAVSKSNFLAIGFDKEDYGDNVVIIKKNGVVIHAMVVTPFEGSDLDAQTGLFIVKLSAECGLNYLKNVPYVPITGRKTLIQVLRDCLSKIPRTFDFDIKVLDNTLAYPSGVLPTGINYWETYVNDENFKNKNCYQVIKEIKQEYNEIVQERGQWLIRNISEISSQNSSFSVFNFASLAKITTTYNRPSVISQRRIGRFGKLFSQQNIKIRKSPSLPINAFPQGQFNDLVGWDVFGVGGYYIIQNGRLYNQQATAFPPAFAPNTVDLGYIESPGLNYQPWKGIFVAGTPEKEHLILKGLAQVGSTVKYGSAIKSLRLAIVAEYNGLQYFLNQDNSWFLKTTNLKTPIIEVVPAADGTFKVDIPQAPYISAFNPAVSIPRSIELGYQVNLGDDVIPPTNVVYQLKVRVYLPHRVDDTSATTANDYGSMYDTFIDFINIEVEDQKGEISKGFTKNFNSATPKDKVNDFVVDLGVGYPSYPRGLDSLFVDNVSNVYIESYSYVNIINRLSIEEHIAKSYLSVLTNKLTWWEGVVSGDLSFSELSEIDTKKYRVHNYSAKLHDSATSLKLIELRANSNFYNIKVDIELSNDLKKQIDDSIRKSFEEKKGIVYNDPNFILGYTKDKVPFVQLRENLRIKGTSQEFAEFRTIGLNFIKDVGELKPGNFTLIKPAENGTYATREWFKKFGISNPNGRIYQRENFYIHRTLGNDNLEDDAYLGATGTTGNWFQTVEKCWDYVNKYQGQNVSIYFLGTTLADPYVINTYLLMSHKGEFYLGGAFGVGDATAYISFGVNGRFTNINTYVNLYRVNITQAGVQSIYLTSGSALQIGDVVFNLLPTATQCIGASNANNINIQGAFTVNFGANNQKIFHNTGNGEASVWIGNHASSIVLNTFAFTGIKWSTTGEGYNMFTHIINTVSFGQNLYPNVDFSGTLMVYGSGMALRTQHNPDNFNYSLVLGTNSPLKFENLKSTSPSTANDTDKFLMVNSFGKVILGTYQGGWIKNQHTIAQPATLWVDGRGTFGEIGVAPHVDLNYSGLSIFNQSAVSFNSINGNASATIYEDRMEIYNRLLIGNAVDDGLTSLQVNGGVKQNVLNSLIKADANGLLVSATSTDITALIGTGNFIQNQNISAQSANFWVNGTGQIGNTKIFGVGTSLLIGFGALSANNVTAVGFGSLLANTGVNNISFGNDNLVANIGGTYNIAIGQNSIKSNVTGNASIGIGFGALEFMNPNTPASNSTHNIAIGLYAMRSALASLSTNNGYRNVMIGGYAGNSITQGNYNNGFGFEALQNVTIGSNNIGIGRAVGYNIGSGSNNIFIGHEAGKSVVGQSGNVIIGGNIGSRLASASNWMLFSDGTGVERFTVDSVGKFGVGTQNPIFKFHVFDTSSNVSIFESSSSQTYVTLKNSSGEGRLGLANGMLGLYHSFGFRMLTVNNTLGVVIGDAIGNGFSAIGYMLEVNGQIRQVVKNAILRADNEGVISAAFSSDLTAAIGSTGYILNQSTLQPSSKFNVSDNSFVGSSVIGSLVGNYAFYGHGGLPTAGNTNYAIAQASTGQTYINTSLAQPLSFRQNGATILAQFNSTGRLLINNAVDDTIGQLQVNGSISANGSYNFFGNAAIGSWFGNNAAGGYAFFGHRTINNSTTNNSYAIVHRDSGELIFNSSAGQVTSFNVGGNAAFRVFASYRVGLLNGNNAGVDNGVDMLQVPGSIISTTIKLTVGATVGHFWKCTGVDGSGSWQVGASGGDSYQGTWVASATYPSATPNIGQWWRITVGGSFNSVTWVAGSDIYWNGSAWVQRPNAYSLTPATTSILGGVIIGAGLSVLGNGTISLANVGTAGTYRSVTTNAFGQVTSGTNPTTILGYGITDFSATALNVQLTGLVAPAASSILSTDSILTAFGKIQSSINAINANIGGGFVTLATAQTISGQKTFSATILGNINAPNIIQLGSNFIVSMQSHLSVSLPSINTNNQTFIIDTSGLMVRTGNSKFGGGINSALATETVDVSGNVRYSGTLMPNGNAPLSGRFLKADSTSTNIWELIGVGDVTGLTNYASFVNYYTKPQIDALLGGGGSVQGINSVLSTGNTATDKDLILNRTNGGFSSMTFSKNGIGSASMFYGFQNDPIDRFVISTVTGKIQIEASGGNNAIELYSNSIRAFCLNGSGTRMVTVDSAGFLGSQAIPSGGGGGVGNLQNVTNNGNTTTWGIGIGEYLYLNNNGIVKGDISWDTIENQLNIGSLEGIEMYTTNNSASIILQGTPFNFGNNVTAVSNVGDLMVFKRVNNQWVPLLCYEYNVSGAKLVGIY